MLHICRVLLSKALSRAQGNLMFTTNIYHIRGLIWSLIIKFPREPITLRAWDRRTLLFSLYNAKFWAKIGKKRSYLLIGTCWGETLWQHVINLDQWEHAKIKCYPVIWEKHRDQTQHLLDNQTNSEVWVEGGLQQVRPISLHNKCPNRGVSLKQWQKTVQNSHQINHISNQL